MCNIQVEAKLDLEATSFSEQNAYLFAVMCKLSYGNKDEVRSALETKGFWGSGAEAGDRFEWFEVRVAANATLSNIKIGMYTYVG